MKIEDCKTLPEFFGVGHRGKVWVGSDIFIVFPHYIANADRTTHDTGRALVGCLTGQLKWSTTEPMSADEEKIIREIAEWFPFWKKLTLSSGGVNIGIFTNDDEWGFFFSSKVAGSKAYEVLAPILEKYGEIDLDDYRS